MSFVADLEKLSQRTWPTIRRAISDAEMQQRRIEQTIEDNSLVPVDTAFVVFGSLARAEWTSGSDLDWALLLDGQADESHQRTVVEVRKTLKTSLGFKPPGPTGIFGGLTSSHELIHRIGGDLDTNRNTTQRVLLLLESRNLGGGALVWDRVLRNIYERYLVDDLAYQPEIRVRPRVPRALLNDVVRYWRTMCVDYASKRRERGEAGWGLRNIKLRLSRKLIFSTGFAACLACELRPSEAMRREKDRDRYVAAATDEILGLSRRSPLDSLARTILDYGALDAGTKIFDAYEAFLALINDETKRQELEKLEPDETHASGAFGEGKEIAVHFQEGLLGLFFGSDAQLTAAAQKYGVF